MIDARVVCHSYTCKTYSMCWLCVAVVLSLQLYEHMQQRGIEPTVATFGTLITIASEAQAYDK